MRTFADFLSEADEIDPRMIQQYKVGEKVTFSSYNKDGRVIQIPGQVAAAKQSSYGYWTYYIDYDNNGKRDQAQMGSDQMNQKPKKQQRTCPTCGGTGVIEE